MKKYLKKKRFYLFLFCLINFLILIIFILKKGILDIDIKSYEFIKNNFINENISPFIKLFTNLGGAIVLIFVSFIMMFFIKNKKITSAIIINLVTIFILNRLIKFIIQRVRPDKVLWLINESGYSFPSAHAMVSMAYYGFLIYLVYIYVKRPSKWILISFLSIIIILIGISRVYLGVHYLSDILGGFLISIAYLIVFITFFNKFINITSN